MSAAVKPPTDTLLEVRSMTKTFPVREGILRRVRAHVHAVSDASLTIGVGETVGLVGESGSGKSTLGRLALRLIEPTAGDVLFEGETVAGDAPTRKLRRNAQMVFQDPNSSFDPLLPTGTSVAEPLQVHMRLTAQERTARLHELVALVGLSPEHLDRYPRELSGGQLQRMAMARALAINPKLLVLDEPVSSLDVSTQAQVINLLERLRLELGVAYLFIAHNPALVHHTSDRIAVMYLGEIVELGAAPDVYGAPKHPYTQALLSAVMVPDPEVQRARRRIILEGDIPNPADPPPGCRFHTRCPYAMDVCRTEPPPAFVAPTGTLARCHLHTTGPRLNGAPISTLVSVTSNGQRDEATM
jgi:oligopeptide/dipeptide ABC transporter ATP-binding protein